MTTASGHLWITGSVRHDRRAAIDTAATADHLTDCHRRRLGPYTGAAGLFEQLVPLAQRRFPELVRRHDIEILSACPGLSTLVGASRETLTSLAVPEERTRFYAPGRTRRLAHGMTEFLLSYARAAGGTPLVVAFDTVHEADHTDRELIAILLRRADPAVLRVIVGTHPEALPPHDAGLTAALERYTERIAAPPVARTEPARAPHELLRAYIWSDGTTDCPAETEAYAAADAASRAALHDERAESWERMSLPDGIAGALPYHRQNGTSPRDKGVAALTRATNHCIDMGFYHGVLELGERGRALADPDGQPDAYALFCTRLSNSLAMLGRAGEAEAIYRDLRSRYTTPMVHLFSNYALGMLHTRHRSREERDHATARIHLNTAIALASLMPEAEQSFQSVFQQNGLALVELHSGNLAKAEELVCNGLDRLEAELKPGEHMLHRSVLLHNRGQVRAALGRPLEAMADFSRVIGIDPNHPEYYFDRAALHRRLGDTDAALQDYETAMRKSPPFAEAHYNRADLRNESGDSTGALEDYSYVLELEPDYLDARINRASLLLECQDTESAFRDVHEGLTYHRDDPQLLCLAGLIAMEDGDNSAALEHLNRALEHAPDMHEALVNRAVLAQSEQRHDDALMDLQRAIDLMGEDAVLLYNRGYVHEAAGHWTDAVRDYTAALEHDGAEEAELLLRRGTCRLRMGDAEGARHDLGKCAVGDHPFAEEARTRLAGAGAVG